MTCIYKIFYHRRQVSDRQLTAGKWYKMLGIENDVSESNKGELSYGVNLKYSTFLPLPIDLLSWGSRNKKQCALACV
jgi:hypothetical protein